MRMPVLYIRGESKGWIEIIYCHPSNIHISRRSGPEHLGHFSFKFENPPVKLWIYQVTQIAFTSGNLNGMLLRIFASVSSYMATGQGIQLPSTAQPPSRTVDRQEPPRLQWDGSQPYSRLAPWPTSTPDSSPSRYERQSARGVGLHPIWGVSFRRRSK